MSDVSVVGEMEVALKTHDGGQTGGVKLRVIFRDGILCGQLFSESGEMFHEGPFSDPDGDLAAEATEIQVSNGSAE